MSIKHENYKLPHVYAVEVLREIQDSANLPLLVGAIDRSTHLRSEYVVKLNASERMSAKARMFELVAAFMAMELGLNVVEPVVVELGHELAELVVGNSYAVKCSRSVGLNYGSLFVKGGIILDNKIALTSKHKLQNQEILFFDTLIDNVDRNSLKPNMITDGDKLILLDHELAFSFLRVLPFHRNNEPWVFNENDQSMFLKHVLYARTKGQVDRLEKFSEKMIRFDERFWAIVRLNIPDEWFCEEEFIGIRTHVDSMVDHRREFIQSVKLLLS